MSMFFFPRVAAVFQLRGNALSLALVRSTVTGNAFFSMVLFFAATTEGVLESELAQGLVVGFACSCDELCKDAVADGACGGGLDDGLEEAEEDGRLVVLVDVAVAHYEDAVSVDDRVEAVGDREHGAVGKGLADGLLDESVCLRVDGRGGLVEQEHLGLAKGCTGKAQQLALAHGKVVAVVSHDREQAIVQAFDGVAHVRLLQGAPHVAIRVGVERV